MDIYNTLCNNRGGGGVGGNLLVCSFPVILLPCFSRKSCKSLFISPPPPPFPLPTITIPTYLYEF